MQRKGLLQRRRTKEDARAYAVKLTDEGRRVLRIAEPLAKRVDERILDALPTKQREQFIDDLLAIVDTLQKLSAPPGDSRAKPGRGRSALRELSEASTDERGAAGPVSASTPPSSAACG